MDDLVERLLKTLRIVFGLLLFMYLMIANSPGMKRGLNLVFYNGMNQLFYWLLWIAVIVILGSILVAAGTYYFESQAKNKEKLEEEEKQRLYENYRKAERIKTLEQKRIDEQEKSETARLYKIEKRRRQIEKEQHLKNRSAEEANHEALKHFL